MSVLETVAEGLVVGLWRTSWQVAALILLVLLVQRVFGRWLSPRWRYALWLLVAVRLMLPVLPEVPGGVFRWEAAGEPQGVEEAARIDELSPFLLSSTRSVTAPRSSTTRLENAGGSGDSADRRPDPAESPPPAGFAALSRSIAGAAPAPPPASPGWVFWVGCGWLVVGLLRAAVLAAREIRFRRRLRREPPVNDEGRLALLDSCRREIGLSREVRLVESDLAGGSPAAAGILHPTILLPRELGQRLSREELRSVFLHELAHHKHADVVLNAAIALLACVWWFHPLVGIAFSRLRGAQELLRDWEALSTPRSPAPTLYAEVLLKLAETGGGARTLRPTFASKAREIRRRILMIADFQTTSNRPWAVGAGLVLILGWLTFTSASSASSATSAAPDGKGAQEQPAGQRHVEVVRHQPPPPWRASAEAALDREVDLRLEASEVPETLVYLREVSGLAVVGEDALNDYGPLPFELDLTGVRLRDALSLICAHVGPDLRFGLVEGTVYLDEAHSIPEARDLRFYKVESLLEESGEEEDVLIDFVVQCTGGDSWDHDQASIDFWTGLLVIRQTEDVHREVSRFLDRLLNDGSSPETESQLRRAAMTRLLKETRLSLDLEEEGVGEVARSLSEAIGVPIMIGYGYEGDSVTLRFVDTSAAAVLGHLARQLDLWVSAEEAGVLLTDRPRVEVELYDLNPLFERVADEEEFRDGLGDLIRNQVSPGFWDASPDSSIGWWDGRLVVRAIPEVHVGIAQLVEALKRVLD